MKKLLYFLFGILTGSCATYFIMQKRCEDKIEKEAKATRDYFNSNKEKVVDKKIISDDPSVTTYQVSKSEEMKSYNAIVDDFRYSAESYHDEDLNIHLAERESPSDEPDIYRIEEDDFYNDKPEHDKITISYYDIDKVFVDDQEEPIDDVYGTIGRTEWYTAEELKDGSDPDIMYIRNNRQGADFEIMRVHGSYGSDVLGLGEDDLL